MWRHRKFAWGELTELWGLELGWEWLYGILGAVLISSKWGARKERKTNQIVSPGWKNLQSVTNMPSCHLSFRLRGSFTLKQTNKCPKKTTEIHDFYINDVFSFIWTKIPSSEFEWSLEKKKRGKSKPHKPSFIRQKTQTHKNTNTQAHLHTNNSQFGLGPDWPLSSDNRWQEARQGSRLITIFTSKSKTPS